MAYVYKHIRLDNNEIFYVGIGNDNNYKRAYQKISRNIFWKRVVNKTKYIVEIIDDNLIWKNACEKEINLIKEIGRRDLGLGSLVNLTDGGEGMNNPTNEVRINMSNRMIKNTYRLNHKHTEETKQKMKESASKKDKSCYSNPERNKKISRAKTNVPRSEKTKEKIHKHHEEHLKGKTYIEIYGEEKAKNIKGKIVQKNTGKKRSENFKNEQSLRFSGENNPMFGKKQSDEFKESKRKYFLSENNPGKNKTEETKLKISNEKKRKPSKTKGIPRKKITCPHCGKIGGEGLMSRWHFENCKYKK
jgi:hypothetical protein